jgi:hypothetical protein
MWMFDGGIRFWPCAPSDTVVTYLFLYRFAFFLAQSFDSRARPIPHRNLRLRFGHALRETQLSDWK